MDAKTGIATPGIGVGMKPCQWGRLTSFHSHDTPAATALAPNQSRGLTATVKDIWGGQEDAEARRSVNSSSRPP
jgi:hypothetical protein